jgi:hypothetical protein
VIRTELFASGSPEAAAPTRISSAEAPSTGARELDALSPSNALELLLIESCTSQLRRAAARMAPFLDAARPMRLAES